MSFCYLTTNYRTTSVFGFPGYIIDSMGWLWTLKRNPPRRIGASLTHSDVRYPVAMLTKSTEYGPVERVVKIHTLVLEEFCGRKPSGFECRHLNGNPLDNRLENLAWGTHEENAKDMKRHGTFVIRRGEDNPSSLLTDEEVLDIRRRWKAGESGMVLADMYGVSRGTIWWITSGKQWKHLLEAKDVSSASA